MKVKNIKIGKKLFLVFAIVTIAMLVLSTFGITSSRQMIRNYNDFYSENYEAATQLYEAQFRLSEGISTVNQAMAQEDTGKLKSMLDESSAHFEEADALFKEAQKNADGAMAKGIAKLIEGTEKFLEYDKDFAEMSPEQLVTIKGEIISGMEGEHAALQQVCEELNAQIEKTSLTSKEAMQFSFNRNVIMLTAISLILIIFLVIIGIKLTRDITGPTKQIVAALKKIEHGDLDVSGELEHVSDDELGQISESLRLASYRINTYMQAIIKAMGELIAGNFAVDQNASDEEFYGIFGEVKNAILEEIEHQNELVRTVRLAAEQITMSSEQVANSSQTLAQGATEQASTVQELAATSSELADRSVEDAKAAKEAYAEGQKAAEHLENCNSNMKDMRNSMEEIYQNQQQIQPIVGEIENIAFQTNILALNAAVEAARAGTAGKGFAVVADEVRNLASRSDEASKRTKALIQEALEAVQEGRDLTLKVDDALENVLEQVLKVSEMMKVSENNAEISSEKISQFRDALEQISSVVQSNSATSEESAAASEEMSGEANRLLDIVRPFRLKEDAEAPKPLNVRQTVSERDTYQEPVDDKY